MTHVHTPTSQVAELKGLLAAAEEDAGHAEHLEQQVAALGARIQAGDAAAAEGAALRDRVSF